MAVNLWLLLLQGQEICILYLYFSMALCFPFSLDKIPVRSQILEKICEKAVQFLDRMKNNQIFEISLVIFTGFFTWPHPLIKASNGNFI